MRPRDLEKEPVTAIPNNVLGWRADNQPSIQSPSIPRIRFGSEQVEAPCLQVGFVERNAETVIRRYIQDQKRFREFYTADRLSKLLAERKVVHITNPVLGFRLLVPQGYLYSVDENRARTGIVFKLNAPKNEKMIPPYDKPFTVSVFHVPAAFQEARQQFTELVSQKRIKPGTNPEAWVQDHVTDSCIKEVVLKQLKLRIRLPNGSEEGDKSHPLYLAKPFEGVDRTDSWTRWNFDHLKEDRGYAVHIGLRDPVMAVTIWQYRQSDRDAFNRKKQISAGVPHFGLIASTVSLY